MSSSSPHVDLRPKLLIRLEPYLNASGAALVVLGLSGGWAGHFWPLVLGIVFLQVIGNIVLTNLTRRWESVVGLRYTAGLWNWAAITTITLVTGGYPSPFWLAFLLSAVVGGVMVDPGGILLNTAFGAFALTLPRLFTKLDRATISGIGMQVLILVVVGVVVWKSAEQLYLKERQLRETEDTLRQSNSQLALSVAQLEQHSREIDLLTGMGSMLQSCSTLSEIYDVAGSYLKELFPSETGSLFIYSPSRNDLEAVVTWGGFPGDNESCIFTPDECWALRQGRLYWQDTGGSALSCRHFKHPIEVPYLCAPMIARGEVLGVLHLRMPKDESSKNAAVPARTVSSLAALAASVAEHMALALANQMLRETLRNQAIRDPLTNLFNRRYAEETLEREIYRAIRKETSLSVIFVDVDHFKLFNDTYGQDAGDAVLQNLGGLIRTHVRREDVACRYGGEEFLIIMSDISLEASRQRAEALREVVRTVNLNYKGQSLANITLSLGVAALTDSTATKEALLNAADTALYRAKSTGRDRVVVAGLVSGAAQAT
jgi:diguanylate cyclase (GGDEF)-like protein